MKKIIALVMNDMSIITEYPAIFEGINLPPQITKITETDNLNKIALNTIKPKRGKVIYKYGRPPKYDRKTTQKIKKLLDSGKSIRTVAKELNMSTATVQKLKKTISENCKLSEVVGASNQAKE